MSSRKGVSPIIAVVILIAVAVSIGIMVTTWVTHWVTTQTSSEAITCSIDTNFVIDSAKYNESGNETLLIKITNKGEKGLYGFGVVLDNSTQVVQFNSTSSKITTSPGLSITNTLGQEGSVYIRINLSNETNSLYGFGTDTLSTLGSSLTEIRVTNDACAVIAQTTKSIRQYP